MLVHMHEFVRGHAWVCMSVCKFVKFELNYAYFVFLISIFSSEAGTAAKGKVPNPAEKPAPPKSPATAPGPGGRRRRK